MILESIWRLFENLHLTQKALLANHWKVWFWDTNGFKYVLTIVYECIKDMNPTLWGGKAHKIESHAAIHRSPRKSRNSVYQFSPTRRPIVHIPSVMYLALTFLYRDPQSKEGQDAAAPRVDHVGFGLVMGEDGKRFRTRSGEVSHAMGYMRQARASWRPSPSITCLLPGRYFMQFFCKYFRKIGFIRMLRDRLNRRGITRPVSSNLCCVSHHVCLNQYSYYGMLM